MSKPRMRSVDEKLIDGNFFSDQNAVYELSKQMRREDGVGFWSVFKRKECSEVVDDAILFNTEDTGQMPPVLISASVRRSLNLNSPSRCKKCLTVTTALK